jgi:outer membrane lipoprotein SlyB
MNFSKRLSFSFIAVLSFSLLALPVTFAEKGGTVKGAVVGGILGATVGHSKIGAAAGGLIGHHRRKKAKKEAKKDAEKQEAAKVQDSEGSPTAPPASQED